MNKNIRFFLLAIPFLIALSSGNTNAIFFTINERMVRLEQEQARLNQERARLIDERLILVGENNRHHADNAQIQEEARQLQEDNRRQELNVLRQIEENNREENGAQRRHVERILTTEVERLHREARRLQQEEIRHQAHGQNPNQNEQIRLALIVDRQEQVNGRQRQEQAIERTQQRWETLKNIGFVSAGVVGTILFANFLYEKISEKLRKKSYKKTDEKIETALVTTTIKPDQKGEIILDGKKVAAMADYGQNLIHAGTTVKIVGKGYSTDDGDYIIVQKIANPASTTKNQQKEVKTA